METQESQLKGAYRRKKKVIQQTRIRTIYHRTFTKQGLSPSGSDLLRVKSEVLIVDDLKEYLHTRYASDELTESEIDGIILSLRTVGGTLYEANKTVMSMIIDGFVFNREDWKKKDIFI